MDININTKNHFTARNPSIRFADQIVRNVNSQYPTISCTFIEGFKCIQNRKSARLLVRLSNLINSIRHVQTTAFKNAGTFEEKLYALINPIKRFRIGNCSELTELTTLSAKANGIENAQMRRLVTPKGDFYDHVVTYIDGEKPYIIDAWAGFADFVPNAVKRYQKDFQRHFNFKLFETEDIIFQEVPKNFNITEFLNKKFTNEELKTLKTNYPELVIKK